MNVYVRSRVCACVHVDLIPSATFKKKNPICLKAGQAEDRSIFLSPTIHISPIHILDSVYKFFHSICVFVYVMRLLVCAFLFLPLALHLLLRFQWEKRIEKVQSFLFSLLFPSHSLARFFLRLATHFFHDVRTFSECLRFTVQFQLHNNESK